MPYTSPKLNLSLVDLRSSNILAISDLSTYYNNNTNTPDSYSLQITPPGWSNINVTFTTGEVNIYKCEDLGIVCGDIEECCNLPDGIYHILYTYIIGSGLNAVLTSIDKKFIKIDQIRCRYWNAFTRVDLECGCYNLERELYLRELEKVKLYIDGAVSESNKGNCIMAEKYYNKATNLLNQLECDDCRPKTKCGC